VLEEQAMRFLKKDNITKTVLVISDIHLGAGLYVGNRRNPLEDFHYDREMVEFLEFYSSGEYASREVELVINGDLFDLLAVPYVRYFDDEFWSEEASLSKLKLILKAHPEVMNALIQFCSQKKKKIVYIIGNHDAEFVFQSLQDHLLGQFPVDARENFSIHLDATGEYQPLKGIVIKHGHEYEIAHHFHPEKSIAEDEAGKRYFIPPWGSYYVTRVLNKFKEERHHINAVRPIQKFLINGLIYDPLITMRFGIATSLYFILVRVIALLNHSVSLKTLLKNAAEELELFRDYEQLTQSYFNENEAVKALIVGHTHEPTLRTLSDGKVFINTGTWTKMYHLDFGKQTFGPQLTYAKVNVTERKEKSRPSTSHKPSDEYSHYQIYLNVWEGRRDNPFREF
jgi:UDP-2,3-diacylglucosamine pyrophosphatase LpxH